jgi:transcriptional regulator of acetoin/glycerol metabolism
VLRGDGAAEATALLRQAAREGAAAQGVFAWHGERDERWVSVEVAYGPGGVLVVEHRDHTAAQRAARRAAIGARLEGCAGALDHAADTLRWLCDVMGWSLAAAWRAEAGGMRVESVVTAEGGAARAWAVLQATDGAALEAWRERSPRWSAPGARAECAMLREALRERAREVVAVFAVPTPRGAVTFYATHPRRPERDFDALLAARFGGARASVVAPEQGPRRISTRARVELAAMSAAPVLLVGEAYAGKTTVAEEIHRRSARGVGALVAVDAGPDAVAALAGVERWEGDAREVVPGAAERARGGALLVEDLSALEPAAQAWLRDAMRRGRYRREGGAEELAFDARVIACDRAELAALRASGRVDPGLLDRLSVVTVEVPPLRARSWELLDVARGVLAEVARVWGKSPPEITEDAARALLAHDWPENLRELRAVLERAWLGVGSTLSAASIAAARARPVASGAPLRAALAPEGPRTDDARLDASERAHVERVLRQTDFKIAPAARLLGISRSTLYARVRSWRLDLDALRAAPAA